MKIATIARVLFAAALVVTATVTYARLASAGACCEGRPGCGTYGCSPGKVTVAGYGTARSKFVEPKPFSQCRADDRDNDCTCSDSLPFECAKYTYYSTSDCSGGESAIVGHGGMNAMGCGGGPMDPVVTTTATACLCPYSMLPS